jgi:ER lumen protein retaining receptor
VREKNCTGLSLKTQDLTAFFLAIRLYCSFMMEYDVHTLLDLLTLVATIWVIVTMRTSLKRTYNAQVYP